jgi:hypothetical protein
MLVYKPHGLTSFDRPLLHYYDLFPCSERARGVSMLLSNSQNFTFLCSLLRPWLTKHLQIF